MGVGGFFALYLMGLGVVWVGTAAAMRSEPTTHGQDVLFGLGCIAGLLWPPFLAYFIVVSPWIAWTWWKTRRERQ